MKILSFKKQFKQNMISRYLVEGLIASYDIESLAHKIQNLISSKINSIEFSTIQQIDSLSKTKYGKVFTLDIGLHIPLSDKENDELEKILNVYGYVNSLQMFDKLNLQLEPKYPVKINSIIESFEASQVFYHITPKKNLSKIKNIGLVPKISQTTFLHPEDRIYLLWMPYTEDPKPKLNSLIEPLALDKGFSIEEMDILKMQYNPLASYYIDDTATIPEFGVYGVFTTTNIHPKQLSVYI